MPWPSIMLAAYPLGSPEASQRLLDARYARFRNIGAWRDEQLPASS